MVRKIGSAWKKNQRREIHRTLGRYLAILAIVALGVGFFAGLKITRDAMVETGDAYIASHNMYDYQLVSTLGLVDDDVDYIRDLSGVRCAEGAYTVDFIARTDGGTESVIEAHSVTDGINLLSLTAGRMPEAADECVADARYYTAADLGTTIKVSPSNGEDTADKFAYSEYTIVGLANSVTYLNIERGTTKLAGGKVNAFVYIPKAGFSLDYYTEIYVSLDAGGAIFSDAYTTSVADMKQPLADALEKRAGIRYDDIVEKATEQITDAESEYNDSLASYNSRKADAEQQLDDAWAQLQDAKEQIESGESKLSSSARQISDAESQYSAGLASYNQAAEQYESSKIDTEAQLESAQQGLNAQRAGLGDALSQAEAAGDDSQVQAIQAGLAQLDEAQAGLDRQKEAAQEQLGAAEAELTATKEKLDASAQQIGDAKSSLASGKNRLAAAKAEYEDNLQKYETSKTETEAALADGETQLQDAKEKIDGAKTDLGKIEKPDCYVLDRTENVGYECFDSDSSIVSGIAKVFPIFFFLVAALVCTTTMTRMVEEQRTQIGTFKALGYGDAAIVMKYIGYSASAAVAGCVIGFFGGIRLFPWVIWTAYGMLYGFAPIKYVMDWKLFSLSLAVSLLCSAGVTYAACRAELTLMPATLMRPKAMKAGKRIILERISFIWNRLSFLRKVSARNVFRYKKRLFMMVLGIGGCTALLLTGFGIRDSIGNIAEDQFANIMKYDFSISFGKAESGPDRNDFISDTSGLLSKCVFVCCDTAKVPTGRGTKTVNVIATDVDGITDMIDLHDNGNAVAYPPDGSVVISEKIARLAGVSAGDSITLKLGDSEECTLTVSGVFENYVYNYVLMTSKTYETVFGKECSYQDALAVSASEDIHSVSAQLMNSFGASAVSVTSDIRSRVANMMKSLDYVVLLVIASAAALAFVVLFNLSNINITERVREIATIKVLGFYFYEVRAYVFRENIVLTTIGALLGIPLGIWLHRFVMSCIDIDIVNFKVEIRPVSFLFALALTFAFTITVDVIMGRKLDKISMVESLKSVE